MRPRRRRRAQTAERVWKMVEGFAGFGFPKAHSAAFGLLAYQSTWLRVHYGAGVPVRAAERAADGLLRPRQPRPRGREPRHRGARPRRERLAGAVHRRRTARVRLGLGYVKDVADAEMRELVAERERGGRYRSLGELAARSGVPPGDARAARLVGRLRRAPRRQRSARSASLWQLGIAAPAHRAGELGAATPAERAPEGARHAARAAAGAARGPAPAPARSLAAADRRLLHQRRDDRRPRDGGPARAPHACRCSPPAPSSTRLPLGCEVAVAGLVIARQRPGTANGTMFLLFEDEFGTINLIVPRDGLRAPPPPRARRAAAARPGPPRAPSGGRGTVGAARMHGARCARPSEPRRIRPVINVIVRELEPLERFLSGAADAEEHRRRSARVHRLRSAGSAQAAKRGGAGRGGGGLEHARRRTADAELRRTPALAAARLGPSRAWATPTSTSSGYASAATCSAGRSTRSARSRCSTRTSRRAATSSTRLTPTDGVAPPGPARPSRSSAPGWLPAGTARSS